MNGLQKIRVIERFLFAVLLIGLGVTGFLYETYKEEVSGIILIPLLIAFMLAFYSLYRMLLKRVQRKFNPWDHYIA